MKPVLEIVSKPVQSEEIVPDKENQSNEGGFKDITNMEVDGETDSKIKDVNSTHEEQAGLIAEPLVNAGIGATLALLKQKGASVYDTESIGGRSNDKIINTSTDPGPVIEYYDEFGRLTTSKEAFRLMSHKFHGKKPGKMKTEKKLKKFLEETKRKQVGSADIQSINAMQAAQEKLKSAYIMLSSNQSAAVNQAREAVTKEKDSGSSRITPQAERDPSKKFEPVSLGNKRKSDSQKGGKSKSTKTDK